MTFFIEYSNKNMITHNTRAKKSMRNLKKINPCPAEPKYILQRKQA